MLEKKGLTISQVLLWIYFNESIIYRTTELWQDVRHNIVNPVVKEGGHGRCSMLDRNRISISRIDAALSMRADNAKVITEPLTCWLVNYFQYVLLGFPCNCYVSPLLFFL